jgi:hypothetical protein
VNLIRHAFGRIARAVLWCFGFRAWHALPYTCDVCHKSSRRRRTQSVALPNWTLLLCPACAERGELEKARKVQKEVGLGVLGIVLNRKYQKGSAPLLAVRTLHGDGTKDRG